MIKKLLLYTGLVAVLFYVTYFLHSYFSDYYNIAYTFNLRDVYLFHAIGSLLLSITFELLYRLSPSLRDQIGFIYMGSTALKVMLFFIIFSEILLYSASMSKGIKISLLIPMGIFILFEVVIVVKILNRTP